MTLCKINVKHILNNKQVKIKYKLNKQTGVYTSHTAWNRWVFNSHLKVTRQQVFFISAGREFHSIDIELSMQALSSRQFVYGFSKILCCQIWKQLIFYTVMSTIGKK